MQITTGNEKVKCNIFDLPTGLTCKKSPACSKYCYAKSAEWRFPAVRRLRTRNYMASQGASFVHDVIDKLYKREKKVVRVHSAGDFYSEDYAMKWFGIAQRLQNFTFYAYTKRDDIFGQKGFLRRKPENFKLIHSLDRVRRTHIELKDANCEALHAIDNGYDKVSIVVDPRFGNCPAIKDSEKKCQVHCSKCSDKTTKIIKLGLH